MAVFSLSLSLSLAMTYTCKLHQSRIHFFRTGFDFLYESSVPFDSFTWHGVLDSSPSFGVVVGRTGLIFFYDHNSENIR